MKTITLFNNKGGVGKTSLVYHLSWMYAQQGLKVLAVDLDPQANLTSMFLGEDILETLWPDGEHPNTVLGCLRPIIRGIGDLKAPHLQPVHASLSLYASLSLFDSGISLLVGDLGLSAFEDKLSASWPLCNDRDESAFRVISAFHRMIVSAADQAGADVVIVDVGPNLGAINRAALIAADHVIIPLAPDLFSMQGLRNLGPTLRRWRTEWAERIPKNPARELSLPPGTMSPADTSSCSISPKIAAPSRRSTAGCSVSLTNTESRCWVNPGNLLSASMTIRIVSPNSDTIGASCQWLWRPVGPCSR
jgi:chromosome partitioning protein